MQLIRPVLPAVVMFASVCTLQPQDAQAVEPEAAEIAVETYFYTYPLVLMDLTRRQMTNAVPGTEDRPPMNSFYHLRSFPSVDDREVVRPNFDTLYSLAWLDIADEPMILSAPDTGGRYYMLPMLDMWSDVFANPGSRSTGTGAGHFAITRQGWTGQLPAGVTRIDSPTPHIWLLGRTQANGPSDFEAVHAVQDGYALTPLSSWGKEGVNQGVAVEASSDPNLDMEIPPMVQVATMSAQDYFSYAGELMKLHPPHITDQAMVARMARIGLVPGESFDLNELQPAVRQALQQAPAIALERIQIRLKRLDTLVNGWTLSTSGMGVYGSDYFQRAGVALIGLGANLPVDALYPMNVVDADGQPVRGDQRYLLHFDADDLPPAAAFWSVTMYDAEGYQVANDLNRFALGDRDELRFNADGSLDIYMQHESPGEDKVSNWLPSPANGVLGVTMRLYAPRREALDGTWVPPAIRRVR